MSNIIEKGWGYEEIIIANEYYCLKKMVFEKAGNHFSMHFHKQKHETWLVQSGKFRLVVVDLKDASEKELFIMMDDTVTIDVGVPHQLFALEDNSVILEVSTADNPEDNHRIRPGMSQTKNA